MFGEGGAGGRGEPTKIKEGGEKGRGGGKKFEIWVEAGVFTGFLKLGYSIIHLMLLAAATQYGNRAVFFFFLSSPLCYHALSLEKCVTTSYSHNTNPAFRFKVIRRVRRRSHLLGVYYRLRRFSILALSNATSLSSADLRWRSSVFPKRRNRPTTCSLLRKNVRHVNNY